MKVLMHDGHVLTLPFTLGARPGGTFDQLAAAGTPAKGVVSTIADGALPGLVNSAVARKNAIATPAELMRDLRFIHQALIDVSEGAEVGIESTSSGYKLLLPEEARAARELVMQGDRCAFNAQARPKAMLNTRGIVEKVQGSKATVRFDEGDRQRLLMATGKDYLPTVDVPIAILDKVTGGK